MRVLIAPNAFKGSLTAKQAAECIRCGIKRSGLDAEYILLPIADGGDGTLEAFLSRGGETLLTRVLDPLQREIIAEYGILLDCKTAIVEMAQASGFALLTPEERNPMQTTSYGTGQMLGAVLAKGCRKIILGVGGSATVDGGIGALQALGMKVLDSLGKELPILAGGRLQEIASIDISQVVRRWQSTQLIIATDVDNPVLGDHGAAAVFGPQKGATPSQVEELEIGLKHFFSLLEKETGDRFIEIPGSGAAGALAGGLVAVLGGRIVSGVTLLLDLYDFDKQLESADLVITGEGYLDEQTLSGKGPLGVTTLARQANVPVIALVGGSDLNQSRGIRAGFDKIISITPKTMSIDEAMAKAPGLLENASYQLGKALQERFRALF